MAMVNISIVMEIPSPKKPAVLWDSPVSRLYVELCAWMTRRIHIEPRQVAASLSLWVATFVQLKATAGPFRLPGVPHPVLLPL